MAIENEKSAYEQFMSILAALPDKIADHIDSIRLGVLYANENHLPMCDWIEKYIDGYLEALEHSGVISGVSRRAFHRYMSGESQDNITEAMEQSLAIVNAGYEL